MNFEGYHLHHLVQTWRKQFHTNSAEFSMHVLFFVGFEHHLQGFVSITFLFCPPALRNILSGRHSSSKTCWTLLNIPISSMKSTFTYSSPGKNEPVLQLNLQSPMSNSIPSFLTFPKSSSNDQSHYLLFGVSLSLRGAMFLATFNDTSSCNLATRHLLEPWELGGFVLSLFGVLILSNKPLRMECQQGFFPKKSVKLIQTKNQMSMGASPKNHPPS